MHSCKCRACAANTLGCQSDVSFVVIAPLYIGYSHRFESRVVVFVKWNEPICLNSFTMWQWNNLRACIKWPSKRRTTEKNSQENVSLENISFISSAVLMTLFCFDFNAIQNARQLISSHKLKWRIVIRWINIKFEAHRFDVGTTRKQDSNVSTASNNESMHLSMRPEHPHTLYRSHDTQSITSPLNYAAPHIRIYCVEI